MKSKIITKLPLHIKWLQTQLAASGRSSDLVFK
jgi:hypothetical protein